MKYRAGFTLIELMVVIVVMVVLTTITTILYSGAQIQARDVQVKDGADKFADAIRLWSAKNGGAIPKGGYASTTVATAAGCSDGASGFQAYLHSTVDSNYQCTIGDAMVAGGYLSPDLFTSMPKNTVSGGTNKHTFMTYTCGSNAKQLNLFYSLEDPTTSDTDYLNSVVTACGANPATYTPITNYGMRGVIPIMFS